MELTLSKSDFKEARMKKNKDCDERNLIWN
jgi:hypothetical protein